MAARPAPVRAADVKRALGCALSLGLKVNGYEIGSDGRITVHTAEGATDSPDSHLEKWQRGRNG